MAGATARAMGLKRKLLGERGPIFHSIAALEMAGRK